jgi:hypothetical protein
VYRTSYEAPSSSCSLLQPPTTSPLTSKYSPQCPLLRHHQSVFFSWCDRPSFTPIQNLCSWQMLYDRGIPCRFGTGKFITVFTKSVYWTSPRASWIHFTMTKCLLYISVVDVFVCRSIWFKPWLGSSSCPRPRAVPHWLVFRFICSLTAREARLGDWGSIPDRSSDFSLRLCVQTGSGLQPDSYPTGTGFLPRGKAAGAWSWQLHLASRLGMRGVVPPLPHTSSWRGV